MKLRDLKQFKFFLYHIPGTFLYETLVVVINKSKNNIMIQTIL